LFSFLVFGLTFLLIAVAEMGDKTQIVVVSLAMRTRRMGTIAAGATLGISLVVVLGVAVGTVLDLFIPLQFIDLGGALIFIALGLILAIQSMLHRGQEGENPASLDKGVVGKGRSALVGSALGVGLMEFGDKTQVVTITLAATYDSPLSVALGAILAEGALMVVGAFVGAKLLARIRRDLVEYLSAFLFILAGLLMILA
jgi:putative Ca2+/H+ antiporter (TMEM165/GDT1 family)